MQFSQVLGAWELADRSGGTSSRAPPRTTRCPVPRQQPRRGHQVPPILRLREGFSRSPRGWQRWSRSPGSSSVQARLGTRSSANQAGDGGGAGARGVGGSLGSAPAQPWQLCGNLPSDQGGLPRTEPPRSPGQAQASGSLSRSPGALPARTHAAWGLPRGGIGA